MSIRRIRAASAALLHTRTAALLAVPALVVGCLFAATAPAAYAAPDCTAATATTNIGIVTAEAGNLNSALGGLSTTATPVEVQTYEQTAVTDLNTMSTDLNGDASYLQDCPSLDDADAQTVANRTALGSMPAFASIAGLTMNM